MSHSRRIPTAFYGLLTVAACGGSATAQTNGEYPLQISVREMWTTPGDPASHPSEEWRSGPMARSGSETGGLQRSRRSRAMVRVCAWYSGKARAPVRWSAYTESMCFQEEAPWS